MSAAVERLTLGSATPWLAHAHAHAHAHARFISTAAGNSEGFESYIITECDSELLTYGIGYD
jgi:hypothetical protein